MVSQITVTPKNVFTPMQSNGDNYTIEKPYYLEKIKQAEIRKDKKSHKLGFTIATSVAIVGFGLLTLTKGLPKQLSKQLNSLFKKAEIKSEKLAQKNEKLTKIQSFYLGFLNKIKDLGKYSCTAFNFTSLKDVVFKKYTDKIPYVNTACKKITERFEKIAIWSAKRTYKKPSSKFGKLYTRFADANSRIVSAKPAEVEKLNKKITEFQKNIDKDFGIGEIHSRMLSMSERLNPIYEKFQKETIGETLGQKVKFVKNRGTYNTFIAERLVAKDKKEISTHLLNIAEQRQKELDAIMDEYKNILPEKDYLKLKKHSDKASKALKKAVKTETSNLFDKIRDLKLGSAPTDCLSILGAFATAIFGLAHADNKDERITASLQYGIPAVGAVSICLLCTTSLVPAGLSLVVGMISGAAINRVGKFIDKKRKEIEKNPPSVQKAKENLPKIK